jgi:integrase
MKTIHDCNLPSFIRSSGIDIEYRTTPWTFLRATEFSSWQETFLRSFSKFPKPLLWCASIHLLECITTGKDFSAIQETGVVYRVGEAARLEWTNADGRTDARELSAISLIALERSGGDPRSAGDLVTQLSTVLALIAPHLPGKLVPAQYFGLCAQAWAFTKLPMFLFSHVIGDAPMGALSRSVLARRECKDALSEFFNTSPVEVEEDFALEGYFHSDVQGEKRAVIDRMLSKLTLENPHALPDRQLQIEIAKRLRTLAGEAEAAGSLSCLILSHCISMLSAGRQALSSQIGYTKYGVPAVFTGLVGRNLEHLESEKFATRYKEGLSTLSGENLRKAKAYVGHFHSYIQEWLDVAPLHKSALPDLAATAIDANVVWPPERSLLQLRIKQQASFDAHLSSQSSLVVDLIHACKARGKEIFLLQVRNIRESNAVVEVEIVTWGRLHGLKTKAAQRVIAVSDESLAARALAWRNMRRGEGAQSNDLLFGTKGDQRRCYRLGLMYPWLNQTLKFCTGDTTSALHHLRHAAADEVFAALDFDDNFHGAIDRLCVDLGHASLSSTRRYLHSFPRLIRQRLDRHLHKLELTSAIVSSLTKVNASTVRKQIERDRKMNGSI